MEAAKTEAGEEIKDVKVEEKSLKNFSYFET